MMSEATPIVRGNTFLDGAAYGASAGAGGLVEDNDVSGGGWIALDTGSHATIRGNRISGALANPVGRRGGIGIINLAWDTTGQPDVDGLDQITAIVEGNEIIDSAYGIEISGLGALHVIR